MVANQNPNPEPEVKQPVTPSKIVEAEVVKEPVTPVVAEPPTSEAKSSQPISPKKEDKGFTARTEETGDKVYLVKDGKRYWVRNPETLSKLGFSLGQEKRITFNELLKCPEGEPIDLTTPGATPENAIKDAPPPPNVDPTKPHKIWA